MALRRSASMPSTYQPHNPELSEAYLSHRRNRTAWAQHWTHPGGPRNTIIVSHGFFASSYLTNSEFFSIMRLYQLGYDVLMISLPFHGRRKAHRDVVSGGRFVTHGPKHVNEANLQAVYDVRSWMNWLFESGVAKVGMTGFSLGGHTTALVASADDRLSFAVPNGAAAHLPSLVMSWTTLGRMAEWAMERCDADWDEETAALEATSPLTYPCQVAPEGRFMMAGTADRLSVPRPVAQTVGALGPVPAALAWRQPHASCRPERLRRRTVRHA